MQDRDSHTKVNARISFFEMHVIHLGHTLPVSLSVILFEKSNVFCALHKEIKIHGRPILSFFLQYQNRELRDAIILSDPKLRGNYLNLIVIV